jgi:DNA-binding FrmR family transcriptional regulator
MIEEHRYRPEIIQQLTALSHAAGEVCLLLLRDHTQG